MRTPVLMLLGIGTILGAAPARAQTYDPSYPVCMNNCKWGAARSSVATHRWRNAMHRRQAAGPYATPIHSLQLDPGSRLAEATDGNTAETVRRRRLERNYLRPGEIRLGAGGQAISTGTQRQSLINSDSRTPRRYAPQRRFTAQA